MIKREDDIKAVHGTSPELLIEKIIRLKIYDSVYWKEKCFGLAAKDLVDRAAELKYIGGTYGGNQKPSKFLCLLLKMLFIQPDMEIVEAFIRNPILKYLTLLGAMYIRLTGTSLEIYSMLEPLLADYRPVYVRNREGSFEVRHMDEIIDEMIRESFFLSLSLPRILNRHALEDSGKLTQRQSFLEELDPEFDMKLLRQEKESKKPMFKSVLHETDKGKKEDDLDTMNALRIKIGLKPLRRK